MKTLLVCNFLFMVLFKVMIIPCLAIEGSNKATEAILTDWEQTISRAPDGFDPKYISMLGDALCKLSRPKPTDQEIWHRLFIEAQQKMLLIPGHAQYFADKLEEIRKTKPKTDDGFERSLYIAKTLIHMPSPETIRVLGNYLHDERDTPPERNWTPENAHLAAYALSRIGLRDFPFEGPLVPYSLTIWPDLKQLPDYRAWWEEVNSGQRTFSFKGQSVEYRFRPDGTWETIPIANPPDDGPKEVIQSTKTNSGKRDEPPASVDSANPDDHSVWWWIAGFGAMLVAVAFALFFKSRRAG
jgi:hypothetical protein